MRYKMLRTHDLDELNVGGIKCVVYLILMS